MDAYSQSGVIFMVGKKVIVSTLRSNAHMILAVV